MSSRYPCAEAITATTIASETKSLGGRDGLSIPSRRRGCSGFRPGVSNESQGVKPSYRNSEGIRRRYSPRTAGAVTFGRNRMMDAKARDHKKAHHHNETASGLDQS